MDQMGLDQSELARRVGCTPAAINQIVNGKTRHSRYLGTIASRLGVSLDYLLGETNDMTGQTAPGEASNDDEDTVEIDSLDVGFGMGGTYLDDDSANVEKVKFSRSWLRQYTASPPELLGVATGIGDSMAPTIHDSDGVIFDRGDTDIRRFADKVWALNLGGVGMIKRLRPKTDGTVEILSDNPLVPPDRATDGELFVIGRVAAIVRKV